MIDEKKVLKVLDDWSNYWGKKTDGISLLKWATILQFKALIKSQSKIDSCIKKQEETR